MIDYKNKDMIDSIVLLGSTGSIGANTLKICKKYNIEIEALVAGRNIELLNWQIAHYKPKYVAVADEQTASKVEFKGRVFYGPEGILEVIERSRSKMVVNSLVGYSGLEPTKHALLLGKKVALANKESLVIAGAFLDTSRITPIDSEHFGLWYLLNGRKTNRLIITASGGAFRDMSISQIEKATYKDALKHPNWSMGDKITIDSATMANKLFELLEARWLFDTTDIDAYIEKKSLIHALVEFKDGSTTAHFADISMELPIAFALLGEVNEKILSNINLLEIGSIEFLPITPDKYPLWNIKESLLENPKRGVVLNAANEMAIEKFKRGECNFFGLCDTVVEAYEHFHRLIPESMSDIPEIDAEVRNYILHSSSR